MGMQNGSQGNVPKIRRRIVVADYAIRKQSEGMGVVSVKFARSLDADTASAVGVVYEDELAAVGVGFFNRWELSRFGTEGAFIGIGDHSEEGRAECQHGQAYAGMYSSHSDITLLLSPNWSVSTPIFWAIRRSRLLMRASVFAGRLQRR
jgi:hypothetical protein